MPKSLPRVPANWDAHVFNRRPAAASAPHASLGHNRQAVTERSARHHRLAHRSETTAAALSPRQAGANSVLLTSLVPCALGLIATSTCPYHTTAHAPWALLPHQHAPATLMPMHLGPHCHVNMPLPHYCPCALGLIATSMCPCHTNAHAPWALLPHQHAPATPLPVRLGPCAAPLLAGDSANVQHRSSALRRTGRCARPSCLGPCWAARNPRPPACGPTTPPSSWSRSHVRCSPSRTPPCSAPQPLPGARARCSAAGGCRRPPRPHRRRQRPGRAAVQLTAAPARPPVRQPRASASQRRAAAASKGQAWRRCQRQRARSSCTSGATPWAQTRRTRPRLQ